MTANSKKKKPTAAAPATVPAPAPAAAKQPFGWWTASIPASVQSSFADKFLAMHRRELQERASLLRRLGYSQDDVRSRLESYATWEYEPFASSPLRAEIAKVVESVFSPKGARTTNLAPGT